MIVVPFAGPTGHETGPERDGVLMGALPHQEFAGVFRSSRLSSPAVILRGDMASGVMSYTEHVPTAAFDWPNSSSPSDDELLVPVTGRVGEFYRDASGGVRQRQA